MTPVAMKFQGAPTQMTKQEFVDCFGGVYEHSPWIAEAVWRDGLDESHEDIDGLADALAATVDRADAELRLNLINAHPDLAGRAAISGELTSESTAEQANAGIDQCTAEEFSLFQEMNEKYKSKFGFTFVMAVKGSNRHKILDAFRRRIQNDPELEFFQAIQEIHKIARLRLAEIAARNTAEV
jgi:OHCU decarboxylase